MKVYALVTDLRAFIQLRLANSSGALRCYCFPAVCYGLFVTGYHPLAELTGGNVCPCTIYFSTGVVLFKPTFAGDLRLAVSLCVITAEAQAHVPLCQPQSGDGKGGMSKLFNHCSKICWILPVKALSPPSTFGGWGFFLLLCGKRSRGVSYRAQGLSEGITVK